MNKDLAALMKELPRIEETIGDAKPIAISFRLLGIEIQLRHEDFHRLFVSMNCGVRITECGRTEMLEITRGEVRYIATRTLPERVLESA